MHASQQDSVSGLSCLSSFTWLSWTNQVVLNTCLSLKHAGKSTACKASAWAEAGYVPGTLLPSAVAICCKMRVGVCKKSERRKKNKI